jgi:PAS domain S-box-containing protein
MSAPSSPAAPMPPRIGLAVKMVLVIALVSALGGAVVYLAHARATTAAIRETELLRAAGMREAVEAIVRDRIQHLTVTARLLRANPIVVAAAADDTTPALRHLRLKKVLDEIYGVFDEHILGVTGRDKRVIYRAQSPAVFGDLQDIWGMAEALAGEESLNSAVTPTGLEVRAIHPLGAGAAPVAAVTVGVRIDDRLAKRMANDLQAHVTLLTARGQVLATSLQRADAERLTHHDSIALALQQKEKAHPAPVVGNEAAVYFAETIVDQTYVWLVSVDSRRANAQAAQARATSLYWSVLAGLIGATLLGALAHRHARRLRTLQTEAEQTIARLFAGEGKHIEGGSEIDSLAAATRLMTARLIAHAEQMREANEAQRRTLEAQFRVMFDGMTDGALITDAHGVITSANPAALRLFDHGEVVLQGRQLSELLATAEAATPIGATVSDANPPSSTITDFARRQSAAPIEVAALKPDGRPIPVEWSCDEFSGGGQRMFIHMLRDITRRKEAEMRIRASLREKEVLLKEIYHRVKNNLQVVSSLLNMQGRNSKDTVTRALFQESAGRVKSMALVHEQLYQGGDLSSINFAAYVNKLARALSDAHGEMTLRVPIRMDSQNVNLGIETAVPLGLIINELISNAYKHAYPNGRAGAVTVRLRVLAPGASESERQIELTVSDDGVGLPAGFTPETSRSLGMQLVVSLTEQLGATLGYESSAGTGTTFTVRFTPEHPERLRLVA